MSFSFPKFIVSFIQLCYSVMTLYLTRGDQVTQFGFFAFGLTVTPYAFMSFINVLAHICSPEYPCLYLVSSPTMEEARRDGGVFDGVIGSVDLSRRKSLLPPQDDEQTLSSKLGTTYLPWISLLVSLIPLVTIGVLSKLKYGTKTTTVTVTFVTLWYSNGILNGIPWASEHMQRRPFWTPAPSPLVAVLLSTVSSVGGMVVVGQMFNQFGNCFLVS
jgi:hypothetical protein